MFTSNLTDVKAVEQLNNALPDSNIILAKWNDQDNSFDLSQCKQKKGQIVPNMCD